MRMQAWARSLTLHSSRGQFNSFKLLENKKKKNGRERQLNGKEGVLSKLDRWMKKRKRSNLFLANANICVYLFNMYIDSREEGEWYN